MLWQYFQIVLTTHAVAHPTPPHVGLTAAVNFSTGLTYSKTKANKKESNKLSKINYNLKTGTASLVSLLSVGCMTAHSQCQSTDTAMQPQCLRAWHGEHMAFLGQYLRKAPSTSLLPYLYDCSITCFSSSRLKWSDCRFWRYTKSGATLCTDNYIPLLFKNKSKLIKNMEMFENGL